MHFKRHVQLTDSLYCYSFDGTKLTKESPCKDVSRKNADSA